MPDRCVQVIVDVPSRALDSAFDYRVPQSMGDVAIGACVVVNFANRPAVGYVVGTDDSELAASALKDILAVLDAACFKAESVALARWVASEYVCPQSEALRLFLPPGGTPKAVRSEDGTWTIKRGSTGAVDDRWVSLTEQGSEYQPRANAHLQRAVIDALSEGPVRVPELAADLGAVASTISTLQKAGVVSIERRRRMRDVHSAEKIAPRHSNLTDGQHQALGAIEACLNGGGGVVAIDGVTGSGKTEVYLRAIESVLASGGSACVLVPEISLTPQTVGRFRSRFGDAVAVLHSRLSAGERYDQWDQVRQGSARVVVGARSALFAPLPKLQLVVIDEEHESSYKQSSAPRYHARDVAAKMAASSGATLVLGSASLSMETRQRCADGEWTLVEMPQRVGDRPLPSVQVVDMADEFKSGHRSMFSRPLVAALNECREANSKAVLFLNRRGFASFVLCRECGHVPGCDSCATTLTYHEVGFRLMCHHCGTARPLPTKCPECGSAYLRQFGAGTQRVEAELEALVPGWPIVRMDADTTRGKGAHERLLAEFESLESGVLLGTQMIAKGLDYPEVTVVGVIAADVTLNLPDFRATERTFQLLEQVAGRAGRGADSGKVVVQTYWPDNPAIVAAANHDPASFYAQEREQRLPLGYPPYGRLVNIVAWGKDSKLVSDHLRQICDVVQQQMPESWSLLGPSPAPLSKLKGVWRWHALVKAPAGEPMSQLLSTALAAVKPKTGVTAAVDVDPLDLL